MYHLLLVVGTKFLGPGVIVSPLILVAHTSPVHLRTERVKPLLATHYELPFQFVSFIRASNWGLIPEDCVRWNGRRVVYNLRGKLRIFHCVKLL